MAGPEIRAEISMYARYLLAPVLALSGGPVLAEIVIDQAMIAGGELRIVGRLAPDNLP